ncbi:hypothetical protein [Tenacibaculum sp. nBUS_03]|uniref:hypothetical protein n=1 Tax=Tenacibaculum sp. nBUS_03 TaxID=3395320 RepID=UPI003EC0E516
MKKSILSLGEAIKKADQKDIFGGTYPFEIGNPNGSGNGSGGGSGNTGCDNPGLILSCPRGKCYSQTACRCVYGQGEGVNMNGICIN